MAAELYSKNQPNLNDIPLGLNKVPIHDDTLKILPPKPVKTSIPKQVNLDIQDETVGNGF